MPAADAYRPDQWHDFFLMVGGAPAALTGLVFVTLSLNLEVVVWDAMHRYRAIGTDDELRWHLRGVRTCADGRPEPLGGRRSGSSEATPLSGCSQ